MVFDRMKTLVKGMVISAMFTSTTGWALGPSYTSTKTPVGPVISVDRHEVKNDPVKLREDLRKLWEDHATWTRLFIISAVHELPNLSVTTQRLLQNQVDIGNAIKPYYGEAAGTELTRLLTDHILIASNLLTAVKNNDSDAITENNRLWYENADAIAMFLSSANPEYWKVEDLKGMLHEHLSLTAQEAIAEIGGDYERSVEIYDLVHVQILHMSDMLADGISKQFP
nr:hypothetical protein BdHM001_17000 [Bdellovibrio sp. HM001]